MMTQAASCGRDAAALNLPLRQAEAWGERLVAMKATTVRRRRLEGWKFYTLSKIRWPVGHDPLNVNSAGAHFCYP